MVERRRHLRFVGSPSSGLLSLRRRFLQRRREAAEVCALEVPRFFHPISRGGCLLGEDSAGGGRGIGRSGVSGSCSWKGSVEDGWTLPLSALAPVGGGVDVLAEDRGWFPADDRSKVAYSGGCVGCFLRRFNAEFLLSSFCWLLVCGDLAFIVPGGVSAASSDERRGGQAKGPPRASL